MLYGIDTWIYEILPLEKALERLEDSGIRYIEYSYEHFKEYDQRGELRSRVKELLDVVQSFSVKAIQMHGAYGEIDLQLASSERGVREHAFRRIKEWIYACSQLGAEVLVLHTVRLPPSLDESSYEQLEKSKEVNIKVFRELAREASEYGINIAVENRLERWIFGWTPKDLILLVEATDPDLVGICLDTGHANIAGIEPASFIRRAGTYIIATHIHDNNGRNDLHMPPLMGNIDWHEVSAALREIGYSKPLICEIASSPDLRKCDNNLELTKLAMESLF